MKRRLLLWAFITVVLLFTIGYVGLQRYINSPALRMKLEETVSESLGMQVQVKSLHITPWNTIAIQGLYLPSDPSVGPDPFGSAERLKVSFSISELLKKNFEISSIELVKPHVRLKEDAQEEIVLPPKYRAIHSSTSSALKKDPSKSPSKKNPTKKDQKTVLFLKKAQIEDGWFEYQDAKKEIIFAADHIQVDGQFRMDGKDILSLGRLRVDQIQVTPGFLLKKIKSPATYSNHWLHLEQLQAESYDGTIQSRFTGKLTGEKQPFQIQLQIEKLDMPQMIRGLGEDPKGFTGKLDLNFQGDGDLRSIKEARGDGNFSIKPVKFEGVPVLKILGELVGLPGLSDTKFDAIQSDFRMEDESIYFKNIETLPSNGATRITGKGRLSFDGKIDFNGNLLLNSGLLGGATQVLQKLRLKHSEGFLNIPFQITGTTQNPKVNVPLLRAAESVVRDILDFVPFIDLNKMTKPNSP